MKTLIEHYKGAIRLVIDDPAKPRGERDVLAGMTEDEGTGCWQLIDVRLAKYGKPNPYAGSGSADTYCANYLPETPEDREIVKSMLREYTELEDGTILWCSFEGVVRGAPSVNGYSPVKWANFDQAGYFSRAEGLERLKEIQAFWEAHEGDLGVKIDNPHRQPTLTEVSGAISVKRFLARHPDIDQTQSSIAGANP
jgi:hypothetical protein